jgi:hypothetical protein
MLKTSFTIIAILMILNVNAQDLRKIMEASFNAFTNALNTKDAIKFKNSLSASSYMNMKNMMLSAKQEFPQTIFESANDYKLDFTKLQFIKTIENGPTGNLIYYDTEGENVILLKFVKEETAWKFSEMESYGTAEIAKKMKAKDMSFLEDKKFKPQGVAPVVQKEVKSVDYMAMLDRTGDYKISIWINGIEQESTNGGSKSGLLMGGVKKGKNTIEIKLSSLEGGKGGSLSVSIRAVLGNAPKEVLVVKEAAPATVITKEFTVQ